MIEGFIEYEMEIYDKFIKKSHKVPPTVSFLIFRLG